MNAINFAENGFLPYWLLRFGIRQRVSRKLSIESSKSADQRDAFIETLRSSAVAIDTDKANDQHYEVPTDFYRLALGNRLKYSSCYWPDGCETLDEAEDAALEQVGERAKLIDGQDVLDLGCGWGSFTLWAAARFPNSNFLSVSNSYSQAKHIREQAVLRNLNNVEVVTNDINDFSPGRQFDRIVSVEMLEHVRNYEEIFARISSWMKEDAHLFIHVFSHRKYAYAFDADNPREWMAREFFTGGLMPSHDLLPSFDRHLRQDESWILDGTHYEKTANAWLENMNRNEEAVKELFNQSYGEDNSEQWMWRWRLFFLACAELFGYKGGSEWGVSHYRFSKRK
jgi:cyclopropane-fatty-acyl-phospholipid synthase